MNYLENYKSVHQTRMNRACHTIGIPMIVSSFIVAFWNWKIGLALFGVGWVFQFLGHWFEGKMPAFFSNPRYLLVGPVWWFKKAFGRKAV